MSENKETNLLLEAEGIVCSGCATDMENVMRDMDGLLAVAVSYANGTIAVTYDPDEVSEAEILATVDRFGIKARIVPG